MADYQEMKDALTGVEAVLVNDEPILAPAIAALKTTLSLIGELLDRLGDVLAGLTSVVVDLDPAEPLRDELLGLLGDVTTRVDALRAA